MKIKKVTILIVFILVGILGVFAGCDNKLSSMKLELDKTVIELSLNDDGEDAISNDTFIATVSGVGNDVLKTVSYSIDDPDNCISLQKVGTIDGVTTFSIFALKGSSSGAVIKILSDQGNREATLRVTVKEYITNLYTNTAYNPTIKVGESLKLVASDSLLFEPSSATERQIVYSIEDDNTNATLNDTTNILTVPSDTGIRGTITIKAECNGFESFFTVNVVDNFTDSNVEIYINDEYDQYTTGDIITLIQNREYACKQTIETNIDPQYYDISIETSSIALDIDKKQGNYFLIRGVNNSQSAKATLKICSKGENNILYQKDILFKVIQHPDEVAINNKTSDQSINVYNYYNDNLGAPINFKTYAFGSDDKRIQLVIYQGQELAQDLVLKYVDGNELVSESDGSYILNHNSTVYFSFRDNTLSDNGTSIVLRAYAYQTIGTLKEVFTTLTLYPKIGVTNITVPQATTMLKLEKGKSIDITYVLEAVNSYTEYVEIDIKNKNIVSCQDSIVTKNNFTIYGLNAGYTQITLTTANNIKCTFEVIVFVSANNVILSMPSINEETNLALVKYDSSDVISPTRVLVAQDISKGIMSDISASSLLSIVANLDSSIQILFDTYEYNFETLSNVKVKNATIVHSNFTSSNSSIVSVNNAGKMLMKSVGTATISASVTLYYGYSTSEVVFDDVLGEQVTVVTDHVYEIEITNLSFEVNVIIPVKTFTILGGYTEVYNKRQLSVFDYDKSKIDISVNITPSNATYSISDISWTLNENLFEQISNNSLSGSYYCKLEGDDTEILATIKVTLSSYGRTFVQTRTIKIKNPIKATSITLRGVTDYIEIDSKNIPYIYLDGRKGLNTVLNTYKIDPVVYPLDAVNTQVLYVYQNAEEDFNSVPVVRVDESGTITPIRNGLCYVYVVPKDICTAYDVYGNLIYNSTSSIIRKIAIKVADGKTSDTAIEIKTAKDLVAIESAEALSLYYVLRDNVDLSNYPTFKAVGINVKTDAQNRYYFETLPFTGHLSGKYTSFGANAQYFITTGLSINISTSTNVSPIGYTKTAYEYYCDFYAKQLEQYYGLFAINEGTITDLNITALNVNIQSINSGDSELYFGLICGKNWGGNITNCVVNITNSDIEANIKSAYIGGIAGQNVNRIVVDETIAVENIGALIENVTVDGILNVHQANTRSIYHIGGIVGNNLKAVYFPSGQEDMTQEQMAQFLSVTATVRGNFEYYYADITYENENISSDVTITLLDTNKNVQSAVGVLVGYNDAGNIYNLSSDGAIVNGYYNCGGIVGYSVLGKIINCYSSSTITGVSNIGGAVGTFSGDMTNVIVEMFDRVDDRQNCESGVKGANFVGGLAGKVIENSVSQTNNISFSFVRSYVNRDINLIANSTYGIYSGDITLVGSSESSNIYVGGLVGQAQDLNMASCYVYAHTNSVANLGDSAVYYGAIIGNLVKSDDENVLSYIIENVYSRGIVSNIGNTNSIIGAYEQNSLDNYTICYTYSTVIDQTQVGSNVEYTIGGTNIVNSNIFENYVDVQELSDITNYVSVWADLQFTVSGQQYDTWNTKANYNNDLPILMTLVSDTEYEMNVEPPSSIQITIADTTLNTPSDIYRSNRHYKIDDTTLMVFYYSDYSQLNIFNIENTVDYYGLIKLIIPPEYMIDSIVDNAKLSRINISSSDISVVSILANGKLKVKGAGSAIITLSSMINKNAIASFKIVVVNAPTSFNIYSTSANASKLTSLDIKYNNTKQIYPQVVGNNEIKIEYTIIGDQIVSFENYEWNEDNICDTNYMSPQILSADNEGSATINVRPFFEYIDQLNFSHKIYLPFYQTFAVNVHKGLTEFKIDCIEQEGSVKDLFATNATITTDITDDLGERTYLKNTNISVYKLDNLLDENPDQSILQSAALDADLDTESSLNIIIKPYVKANSTTLSARIDIAINTDIAYISAVQYIIKITANDDDFLVGNNTSITRYMLITVNPQTVISSTVDFYAQSFELNDNSQILFNVNEVPSTVIKAGEEGIIKAYVYPDFAYIKKIDITAYSPSGATLGMQQMVLRENSEDMSQNSLEVLNPSAPKITNTITQSGQLLGGTAKGVSALLKTSVQTNGSVDEYSFDGIIYIKALITTAISEDTVFVIQVRAEDYQGNVVYSFVNLIAKIRTKLDLSVNDSENQVFEGKNYAYIASGVQSKISLDISGLDNPRSGSIKLYKTVGSISTYIGDLILENGDYYIDQTYWLDDGSSFELYAQAIDDDTGNTFRSNTIKVQVVEFRVTGFTLSGSVDNRFVKQFDTAHRLSVELEVEKYSQDDAELESKILALQNSISNSLSSYYYNGSILDLLNTNYSGKFEISQTVDEQVYIKGKLINVDSILQIVIGVQYVNGEVSKSTSTLDSVAFNSNGTFTYKENVTVRFTAPSDEETPIAITTIDDLYYNMIDGGNYILMNDLVLGDDDTGFTPLTTLVKSFDGNGYKITIKKFNIPYNYDSSQRRIEDTTDELYLGLFKTIETGTVLKNVYVVYDTASSDFVIETQKAMSEANETMVYKSVMFGGIVGQNNGGLIYNCATKTSLSSAKISFNIPAYYNDTDAVIVNIGGIAGKNEGNIAYSHSTISISTTRGNVGGITSENSGAIVASYYKNGFIVIDQDSDPNSSLGGLVSTNTGSGVIRTSYVEGQNLSDYRYTTAGLCYGGIIGGFVSTNLGEITNCYSNIKITSSDRCAGFVFTNNGLITNCYSASQVAQANSTNTPFVGTNSSGIPLSTSDKIINCYYLDGNFAGKELEYAKKLTSSEILNSFNFDGYLFGDDYVWTTSINYGPQLVDASIKIGSQRMISQTEDGIVFIYKDGGTNAEGNTISIYGTENNPYAIYTIDDYNKYFEPESLNKITNKYFNIVSDLNFISSPLLKKAYNVKLYGCTILGNGMKLTNFRISNTTTSTTTNFGLFQTIEYSIIKNMYLAPSEVVATNSIFVGTLGGTVKSSELLDITIKNENVVVQGKNVVGGVAGILTGTTFASNINVSISVNSIYKTQNETDKTSIYQGATALDGIEQVSYAGAVFGIVDVSTTIDKNNTASVFNLLVSGNSRVIGNNVGTAIGLIGNSSYIDKVGVITNYGQYINGTTFVGGVIGENRGLLTRASITQNRQSEIDSRVDKSIVLENVQNTNYFNYNTPSSIGGLVGFNNGGTIENSYSTIDVINTQTLSLSAGGLIGVDINGNVYNCFTTGSVYANSIIGGVVGIVATYETLMAESNGIITNILEEGVDPIDYQSTYENVYGLNNWLNDETLRNKIRTLVYLNGVSGAVNTISNAVGGFVGAITEYLPESVDDSRNILSVNNCRYQNFTFDSFVIKTYGNANCTIGAGEGITSYSLVSDIYASNIVGTTYGVSLGEQTKVVFAPYSSSIWNNLSVTNSITIPTLKNKNNIDTNSNAILKGVDGTYTNVGKAINPFAVYTAKELVKAASLANSSLYNINNLIYIKLMDNIDMNCISTFDVFGKNASNTFYGVFDGNGKSIVRLNTSITVLEGVNNFVGLFKNLSYKSVVKNLSVEAVYTLNGELSASNFLYIGGIAANVTGGTITNCNANTTVQLGNFTCSGTVYSGKIAGYASSAAQYQFTISGCSGAMTYDGVTITKLYFNE